MPDPEVVLLVEDDPSIRFVIQATLADAGLRVQVAPDGRAAIELAQTQRPSLVLLDMMLPDMTGDRVAAELKTTYGESLPIIVVTADADAAKKATAVGAVAHMAKPFELTRLVELVRQHIA